MNYGNRTPDMLPTLGSKTAPKKFTGNFKKVKDFLEKYDRMCNAYHLTDPDKCLRLTDYCSDIVTQLIESLTSYRTHDWAALKASLLDYYDADLKETRHNIGHMRKLVLKWRKHPISSLQRWKKFRREFTTIGGWLEQQGRISEQEQATYFWHGIHKTLRNKIEATITARNPTIDLTRAIPMEEIEGIVRILFTRNRFDSNLVESEDGTDSDTEEDTSESDSGQTSDSDSDSDTDSDSESDYKVHKHSKKSRSKKKSSKKLLSKKQKSKTASLDKALEQLPKNTLANNKAASKTNKAKQDEVEGLIEKMGQLSLTEPKYARLYYKALKLDSDIEKCVQASTTVNPIPTNFRPSPNFSRPMRINNIGMPLSPATMPNSIPLRQGANMQDNRGQCFGCGKDGHTVRNCPDVQIYVMKGLVKQDPVSNRLQLNNGTPIYRQNNETLVQAIQRYTVGPAVQANFVGIPYETEVDEPPQVYSVEDDGEIYQVTRTTRNTRQQRKEATEGTRNPMGGSSSKNTQANSTMPSSRAQRFNARQEKAKESQHQRSPTPERGSDSENDNVSQRIYDPKPRYNPQEVSDVEMEDEQPIIKPRITRNPPKDSVLSTKPKIRQSEIQRQVPKDALMDKLLETEVPKVTVKELIACSETLSSRLGGMLKRKNMPQDDSEEVVPAMVNLLTRNKALLIRVNMTCAKHTIEAVVDCGSQLNIMKRSIFEKYLADHYAEEIGTTIKVKDASGNEGILQGRVPKVLLEKGSIQTYANIYLGSDDLPFDLLLGRPWQRDNFVGIDERDKGTYLVFRDIQQPDKTMELCVMREFIEQPWRLGIASQKHTTQRYEESSETESEEENTPKQAMLKSLAKLSVESGDQSNTIPYEKYSNRGYIVSSLEIVPELNETIDSSESETASMIKARIRRNRQKRKNLVALENYLHLINRRGSAGINPLWSSDELEDYLDPFQSDSSSDCPPLIPIADSESEESDSDITSESKALIQKTRHSERASHFEPEASSVLSITDVNDQGERNSRAGSQRSRMSQNSRTRRQHESNESVLRDIADEFHQSSSHSHQTSQGHSNRHARTSHQEQRMRTGRHRPISIRIVQEVSIDAEGDSTETSSNQAPDPPPSPEPWTSDWPQADWGETGWQTSSWPNDDWAANEWPPNNWPGNSANTAEEVPVTNAESATGPSEHQGDHEMDGISFRLIPEEDQSPPYSPTPLGDITNGISTSYEPRQTQSLPETLYIVTSESQALDSNFSNPCSQEIQVPRQSQQEYIQKRLDMEVTMDHTMDTIPQDLSTDEQEIDKVKEPPISKYVQIGTQQIPTNPFQSFRVSESTADGNSNSKETLSAVWIPLHRGRTSQLRKRTGIKGNTETDWQTNTNIYLKDRDENSNNSAQILHYNKDLPSLQEESVSNNEAGRATNRPSASQNHTTQWTPGTSCQAVTNESSPNDLAPRAKNRCPTDEGPTTIYRGRGKDDAQQINHVRTQTRPDKEDISSRRERRKMDVPSMQSNDNASPAKQTSSTAAGKEGPKPNDAPTKEPKQQAMDSGASRSDDTKLHWQARPEKENMSDDHERRNEDAPDLNSDRALPASQTPGTSCQADANEPSLGSLALKVSDQRLKVGVNKDDENGEQDSKYKASARTWWCKQEGTRSSEEYETNDEYGQQQTDTPSWNSDDALPANQAPGTICQAVMNEPSPDGPALKGMTWRPADSKGDSEQTWRDVQTSERLEGEGKDRSQHQVRPYAPIRHQDSDTRPTQTPGTYCQAVSNVPEDGASPGMGARRTKDTGNDWIGPGDDEKLRALRADSHGFSQIKTNEGNDTRRTKETGNGWMEPGGDERLRVWKACTHGISTIKLEIDVLNAPKSTRQEPSDVNVDIQVQRLEAPSEGWTKCGAQPESKDKSDVSVKPGHELAPDGQKAKTEEDGWARERTGQKEKEKDIVSFVKGHNTVDVPLSELLPTIAQFIPSSTALGTAYQAAESAQIELTQTFRNDSTSLAKDAKPTL